MQDMKLVVSMFDKRIPVIALLLLLSVSLNIAFAPYGISEAGYSQLVSKSSMLAALGIPLLKWLVVLAAFLSSAIVFLFVTGIGKECEESSLLPGAFAGALLLLSSFVAMNIPFATSPLLILSLPLFTLGAAVLMGTGKYRLAGLLPLAIGLFLTYPYISPNLALSVFSYFPVVAAFASLSIGYYLADKELVVPMAAFASGIVTLFVLPPLSLGLLSCAAAFSLKRFFAGTEKVPLLLLLFSLAFFPELAVGNIQTAVIAGASIAALAYLVLSLYYFRLAGFAAYLSIFAVVLSFSMFYVGISTLPVESPDSYLISALGYAKEHSLAPAILEMPGTYEFYTGKAPNIFNGTKLISKEPANYQYMLLSAQALPVSFAQYPVSFGYVTTAAPATGGKVAVFAGGPYILEVPVSDAGEIGGDGRLYSRYTGGFVRSIPFTKLKKFSKSVPLEDHSSVLINVDGYEDTQLYALAVSGQAVYENKGAKIVKVE